MRPLTESQLRLLSCPAGYTVRGRVRVLGPDGATWHNLSALFERDFLEGVEVDESLDSPVAQATVRVLREVNGLSLAPLVTDSRANHLAGAYAPLLDVGRAFRVEVGLAPLGGEPGPGDWLPLFYGRVDDVDAGAQVLTFKGRDFAGVLQDVWLRQEHQYGSTAGTPLQTVCQSILNDAHLSAFGLYVPTDLAWDLGPYNQAVEPVADALAKLATARGAEWRWKLRPDTGDWGLWLWVPDRTATEPVWEWGPRDYVELGALATSLADVRTLVEAVYSDPADLDAAGQPKRKTVVREDVAATARYGYTAPDGTRVPRFMRVAEGAASNIRSQAAAERLADAALADLSSSSLGVSVEVSLHPALELADLVRLAPNGVHFLDAQTLAARQVTHSLSASGGTTRVQLLGKPSLSPRAWLGLEARPGVAPAPTFTGPSAPSGVAVTGAIAGAVLVFTAPDGSAGPEADSYELHLGASPGFTLSAASLKAVSSSTRFDLTGLAPGLTYYARVRSRDRKGNVGPASSEVTINPQYLTPQSMLKNVSFGTLPLNGDFEAQVDTNAPPDAFTLSGGTWGLDATASADSFAGARAVVFPAGRAAATLTAQAFTVRMGEQWVFSCWYKQGTDQVVSGALRVRFYSDLSTPMAVLSSADLGGTASQYVANLWRRQIIALPVPDGARYVVLSVVKDSGYTGSLTVDSLDALRRPSVGTWSTVTYQNNWIAAAPPDGPFQDVRYRRDDFGRVELRGVLLAPNPVSSITAFTLPVGYRPFEAPRVYRTHNQGQLLSIYINLDGTVAVFGATANSQVPLDGIAFDTLG